jgi:hypothetical protein
MDVDKLIQELSAGIEKLKRVVLCLEQLRSTSPGRRGRKGMGAEERLQVAERMKKYWARRRRQS